MMTMKRVLAILLSGAVVFFLGMLPASAAENGWITGGTHTHGTERAMKIQSDSALGVGGVSWDVAAPKDTKPELRSDVWLVPENLDFSKIPLKELEAWYQKGKIPKGTPIRYTKAVEDGTYTFKDVPAGEYYLIILDPYGKSYDEGIAEREARYAFIAKLPREDEFELYMVGFKSCLVQKVTVQSGKETHLKLNAVQLKRKKK